METLYLDHFADGADTVNLDAANDDANNDDAVSLGAHNDATVHLNIAANDAVGFRRSSLGCSCS